MDQHEQSRWIQAKALELGFSDCGFAQAGPVSGDQVDFFAHWLAKNRHAEMAYMASNISLRLNPQLLEPDCLSVVVVLASHELPNTIQRKAPFIAKYAHFPDYHYVLKDRLNQLLRSIQAEDSFASGRAFTDSAPILERYWAVQAGLGWIGKNRMLLSKKLGSYQWIGILLLNRKLDYAHPIESACGNCTRCLDACPGKALDIREGLDANRCLSYLTIEKRGDFSEQEKDLVSANEWLFGCDICQMVCPWNRFSSAHNTHDLIPYDHMEANEWMQITQLSNKQFERKFAQSSLLRTGAKGLRRNWESIKKRRNL